MKQNRRLRRLRETEKIDFIKFVSGINKDDIDIILSSIVPKLPRNCIFISKGKANFTLMEKIGEFITKGKFAEIEINPQKICERCQFHSVCKMFREARRKKNLH